MVALAALITAVSGAIVALWSALRASRADSEKHQEEASAIGLSYLSAALERQGREIAEQGERIARLEIEVVECHRERDRLSRELAVLRGGGRP